MHRLDGVGTMGIEVIDAFKDALVELLPTIKELIDENRDAAAEIQDLRARVNALGRVQVQEPGKVFLGQAASTLDKAACLYVFGNDIIYLSVKKLHKQRVRGGLTPQQAQRWDEFASFVARQKWSLDRLVTVMKPLQELRKMAGRVTPEEQASVTPEQLHQWGQDYLPGLPLLSNYFELLACLTRPGQPLVLLPDVSSIIKEPLQAGGSG